MKRELIRRVAPKTKEFKYLFSAVTGCSTPWDVNALKLRHTTYAA